MKTKKSMAATATHKGLWDPGKVLSSATPKEQDMLDRLDATLTTAERRRLRRIAGKLDQAFIQEKAELVRDTIMEIQRKRRKTPNTLLQRNVWSSLDVIGMELDRVGFTRWLKDVTRKVVKGTRLDDPAIVSLEHKLMRDFMGVTETQAAKLGLPLSETQEVLEYAQKQRTGRCGLSYITSEEFSFRQFFRDFCGRPDQILEIHHSPQAKAGVALVVGVVNIVGVFFGWVLTVITVIMLIIIGCSGC